MKRMRTTALLLLLAVFIPLLAACSSDATATPGSTGTDATTMPGGANGSKGTIKVGTKNFAEQYVLGEMYRLVLENAGYEVTVKEVGATPVAQAALQSGEIDLYPEYTGTGLLTVLQMESFENKSDSKAVYDAVAKGYKEQFNLVWLDAAPMNNTQALAMTRAASGQFGVKTISDLAAKASELRMIGPQEFQAREDGLPGIQAAYGNFALKQYVGVDPGLKYQGLLNGDAEVVVAFGTDGEIAANDLVVLTDDKGLFPIYQVAPVVRQETLDKYADVRDLLNGLAPKLTDDVMRTLNYEVTRPDNAREPVDVAREFLQKQGLIK